MDQTDTGVSETEVPEGDVQQIAPQEPQVASDPDRDGFEPIDVDSDGTADGFWGQLQDIGTFVALDTDGDRAPDYIELDTNGDGLVDVTVQREDGVYRISVDSDMDGVKDREGVLTEAEFQETLPMLWELIAPAGTTDGLPAPEQPSAPVIEDGRIVGDPFAYSDDWFEQAFDGSCLPASVAQIYAEYTGQPITDLEFVELVNEQGGWVLGPDGKPGMMPASAVDLLNSVGIEATLQYSDLDGLMSALDEGRAVMVAIDSGEYWFGESTEDDTADHAVLVTGIDVEAGIVYLSDTGTESGDMLQVPLETFLDAWADSDNTMVVCDESAQDFQNGEAQAEAAMPGEAETAQPEPEFAGAFADLTPGLPGEGRSGIEQATSWLVQHPWIVLPIVLAAGAGVARLSSK